MQRQKMMFTDYCKQLFRVNIIIAGLILACCLGIIYAAENTNSASAFLCEYGISLYRQGNTEDAIHQLKKSLMINPNNAIAQKFLDKIVKEQGLGVAPQEPKKEAAVKEETVPAAQPNKELINLQEENRSYKEQLNKAADESLNKEKSLKTLSLELASLKEGYQAELSKKEKELQILKSNYESDLRKLNDEMNLKDSEFKEMVNEKDSLLHKKDSLVEKYRKSKTEQIAGIENLMRQIDQFLHAVEEPLDKKSCLSKEGLDSESEQIAKIEDLMRQIEEVLPKSD
jgi:hypothetical protein